MPTASAYRVAAAVNWCPTDWAERAAGVAQLRVDTWVMPSHTQAARESAHELAPRKYPGRSGGRRHN